VSERHVVLTHRGLQLEYATLGWNVVTICIVVSAAVVARSVALAGFALDSGIEIFASAVVIWHLRGDVEPARERRAARLIGVAFLALAVYLVGQTVVTLVVGVHPDSSAVGIAWLAATCVVMFSLAAAKARTGRALGNAVLQSEAKVTVVDGCLAAAVLLGLVLNSALGWWWADLAAGLVVIGYGLREGRTALRTT
jgi:divalent metal cation (Fe/Co/Zn/Cd) transporter